MKPILGKPIFKEEDRVKFLCRLDKDPVELVGTVYIVDAWGTFEQREEPSYDVMVDDIGGGTSCLFKHIEESSLSLAE